MKKIILAATAIATFALAGCVSGPQAERFQRENYEAYGLNPIEQYYHPFSHVRSEVNTAK